MMPFFNRAATLPRAIGSVLGQTYHDWELIAVDDGSSDPSAAVVRSFGDERIRLLRHERNRGVAAARNTALDAARGEFIALLDSDDEWLPEKLARQITAMEGDPQRRAFCSCPFEFYREHGVERWPHPWRAPVERALHFECTFGFGATLVVRQSAAASIGEFDPQLPRHEDWDWVLRGCEQGFDLLFLEEPLARVISSGLPEVERMIPSMHRFLARHDGGFRRFGGRHRRRVRAHHFESIASMAYLQRKYRLGHEYLLRSYAEWPWRSPLPLAALPVGIVDAMLGTRFIQRGADWRRSRATAAEPAGDAGR
jgi:glycosyltransferase involved in cell wall biosynthesis